LPDRAGVDSGSVVQEIKRFLFQDANQSEEIGVDGCVIDRTRFDKTLAINALESAADLCNGFVIRREERTLIARRNGVEAPFHGGAIVCADGAASVVSKSLVPSRRRFLTTMQFDVGLENPCQTVSLKRPVIAGRGLGWFIPSGRTAKIGIALPQSMSRLLKPALASVMRDHERDGGIFKNSVLGVTGGLVPIDRRAVSNVGLSVLVAGDARGGLGVDGAGISNAVLSGELAGITAHNFLKKSASADVIENYGVVLDRYLGGDRDDQSEGRNTCAFQRWVTRTQQFLSWGPEPLVSEAS
jgi:flavin-dependent dehydrogenase